MVSSYLNTDLRNVFNDYIREPVTEVLVQVEKVMSFIIGSDGPNDVEPAFE